MIQKKTRTVYTLDSDYRGFVDMLKAFKADFTVENSNYTFTVETDTNKTSFLNEERGLAFFKASNKLKKHFLSRPELLQRVQDDAILKHSPSYFDSQPFIVPFSSDAAINIDVVNAYPSVLRRFDLIDDELFNMLNRLSKKDKLAALGSLAATKTRISYAGGQPILGETIEAPTKPIFLFCVHNIDLLIKEISFMLGDAFIFYWVDGIYIKQSVNYSDLRSVEDFIAENGYKMKVNLLKDIDVKRCGDLIDVHYKELNGTRKQFLFPDQSIIQMRKKMRDEMLKEDFSRI